MCQRPMFALSCQHWQTHKDNNNDEDNDDDSGYDEEEEKDNTGGDMDALQGPLWINTLHIPSSNQDIPKCSYWQSEHKL